MPGILYCNVGYLRILPPAEDCCVGVGCDVCGFCVTGARDTQHGPPPLQSGIDYINPGEEDQMVSVSE
jgi:hypothetical protein